PGSTFNINGNTTLYAIWKENAKYTITYNGNKNTSGLAPTDSSSPYYVNSSVNVLGAGTLRKANYTFIGWNTKDDGTGIDYSVLSIFSIKEDITLYAKWQENNKYTITYFGNENTSGSVPSDSSSPYYVGSSVTILGVGSLVKANYTFDSWNTKADGSGDKHAPGSTFNINGNTTLYAIWKENARHTITYNGNENTGGDAPVDGNSPYYTGSSIMILGAGSLTRSNHSFIGWNTQADGLGVTYNVLGTLSLNNDLVLYAKWKENDKYSITYHGNTSTGGDVPVDNNSPYYVGNSVSILEKGSLVRANYTFDSWNTKADNSGTKYTPGASFNINAHTNLYAIWKENNKYRITYHGNLNTLGSVPVDLTSPYYDGSSVIIMNQNSLIKTNYTFMGWNSQDDGSGVSYNPGASFNISGDTNLYAIWQENDKYTITYHGNENTSGSAPVDASSPYYTGSSILIDNEQSLEKENFTFMGWNTQADNKGLSIEAGTNYIITSNTNLYAIWKENTKHKITYHGNENTSGDDPVDLLSPYYIDSEVDVLTSGNLSKEGYRFFGWNTKDDGKGRTFFASEIIDIEDDIDLYAMWELETKYRITYFGNENTSGQAPFDALNPYDEFAEAIALEKGTLEKANFKFKEWNTQSDGLGSKFKPGDIVDVTNDINLYAIWEENNKYSITYFGNENSSGSVPVDGNSPHFVDSKVIVLGKSTLSKTNYTFIEWNTQADGLGTPYKEGSTLTIKADTNLYAIWKENAKYTITYFGNNNTSGSVPTDS
ncbi:MAG: InlB B-repeat-containing protein, partial [Bacilli bacterium]